MELSPSGTGLHAIVRGQLPGPGRRRGQVEIYDRARFFTITGRALSAPGSIAGAQAAIDALYVKLGGQAAGAAPAPLPAEALDWPFVDWLEAHKHRLIGPDGLPYGATPQLRDLLLRGQLPAGLDGSDSARRALVVRQLAAAGYMREEIYLLARQIWARYGYESNKRPQDLVTDALRLLARYQVAPGAYSAHSLARYQEYRHGPQQPARSPQAAPGRPQAARRAACTPDAYLAALSSLDTGCGMVVATRAERAQAAGVSMATAERRERELQAAGAIRVELYTCPAGDGRRTRASKVVLIPVSASAGDQADADTGIIRIAVSGADADTIVKMAAEGSSTAQSGTDTAVCIGEDTVCVLPPTPRAPAAAGGHPAHPVSSPSPAPPVPAPPPPPPLAELVSEAIDAYGTAGGKAARRRVVAHVRAVGGLAVGEGAIVRAYLAELARRKHARADAALRRKAEGMSPTKRRARLRTLERSIAADLALAADLRVRPLTAEGEKRSPKTPAALAARAYVWARQYAIIAQVHEERQIAPELEEAALLAEAGAVIERLRAAGELPGRKPRASFKPANAPGALPPGGSSYDSAGLADRLRGLKGRRPALASCAD